MRNEVRKVYAEARFLMDRVTQDVRLNTIDYRCLNMETGYESAMFLECSGSVGQASVLPLISVDGLHRVVYRFEQDSLTNEGELSVLELDWDDFGQTWMSADGFQEGFASFETANVVIEAIDFVMAPVKDPYDPANSSENSAQYHPSVHVVIQARGSLSRLSQTTPVKLQSTISSRVYAVDSLNFYGY